jgi:DNA-binding CsgD family transcriptional regulator
VLLEVSPLRDTDREIDARFRGSIISIVDPDRAGRINCAGVQALYGLTPAEVAVLDPLVLGKSNQEIAEVRGVSPETVKAQIRSVFAKMAVHNRAELVRRVFTVNLPVEGL